MEQPLAGKESPEALSGAKSRMRDGTIQGVRIKSDATAKGKS
ncbi:MAG: hypothetical protein ABSF36_03045 [Candidatus Methanomethylicaceae archaeon]